MITSKAYKSLGLLRRVFKNSHVLRQENAGADPGFSERGV